MKAFVRALGVVAVTVLIAGLCLGERAQVATDQAVLTWMYGVVQVRHGTSGWAAAQLNETLSPGDAIKTGADSRAELSLGRDGWVRMDERSQLLITHLQEGGLSSLKAVVGGIWVTIERALTGASKFEVQMPSAVATVHGTVFRCQVSEGGASTTFVYEGEVEINAGQERVRVRPLEHAFFSPGLRIALSKTDLSSDDEAAFVKCSRNRDILWHLGSPKVMVALTEEGLSQEQRTFTCSQLLGATLRRSGFTETCVKQTDVSNFTVGENGWIRWRKKPNADYYVVGRVSTGRARRLNGVFSARAQGTAYLVDADQRRALVKVTSMVPGTGGTEREALEAALRALGQRLGIELAPRIVRELMSDRPGTLRIDLSGVTNRRQVHTLCNLVSEAEGIVRAAPLPLPGGRVSLAVAGDVDAETLAQAIRTRASELVESVRLYDRVIYVKLKPAEGEQPGGR